MTTFFNPMPPVRSSAQGWLQVCSRLAAAGDMFGVTLHIEDPTRHSTADNRVILEVDRFLKEHHSFPITTVANTIFPSSLYVPGERELLYSRYAKQYPKIKAAAPDWGRYFDRMTRWKSSNGKATINQLEKVVENLKKYGPAGEKHVSDMYEMTLFNPEKDSAKFRGRQCLSFVELKPEFDGKRGRLHMIAVYRSHFYISKALGNLVGLGRLLHFIAREAGTEAGTMTIHSTHAALDVGERNDKRCSQPWGKAAAKELVKRCEQIAGEKVEVSALQAV